MGPKGTGLLYISREAAPAIEPVQWEAERRYESNSTGVGPIPLAIGLGVAIDRMLALRPGIVERRVQLLRDHAWRQLSQIPVATMVGPPPGTASSGLAACMLPVSANSLMLRQRLLERHRTVVKMIEKRFFNGIRLSPHIFNTEAEIDRCVSALRAELA
jgi:cysteine desulfurase/selenocysteine lyase